MKPRYLFGIILELAIAAVTLLIGKVLLVAGFDARPAAVQPHSPARERE